MNKDKDLEVTVKNGKLTISIGIDTLAAAAEHMEEAQPYNEDTGEYLQLFKVTDPFEFAQGIRNQLLKENPDTGATALHWLFDGATMGVLEDGEEGVEMLEGVGAFDL